MSHLCLSDRDKQQIESYLKRLIIDDIYPLSISTTATNTQSTSMEAISDAQPPVLTNPPKKLSAFEEFLAACGEDDDATVSDNVKERSKRILINEELKYYKLAVQEFNISVIPSTFSAIKFWKLNKDRFPLLSHLAKIYLTACATSVPSESAFSVSAYLARKERARLSPENLAYTVFLKDKVLIDC